jgi:HD-GYP domain-containing protein (c-di-GMP phosphodiesterase class II)
LISVVFGQELGLSRSQVHELGMAALFHDVGMAEVEPAILTKRRSLSKEERRLIDLFPLHTVKTLLKGRSLDLQMTKRIIAAYESKVDYSVPMKDPDGTVRLMTPKVELGLYGSIISITACYDALTSARPFREAYGPEVALTLMVSDMQYKFDPFLLKVFLKVMAIQPVKVLPPGQQTISFG